MSLRYEPISALAEDRSFVSTSMVKLLSSSFSLMSPLCFLSMLASGRIALYIAAASSFRAVIIICALMRRLEVVCASGNFVPTPYAVPYSACHSLEL